MPKKAKSKVRIWSGEHFQWWMPDGCGYTPYRNQAGIYDYDDAVSRTKGSGREKKIKLRAIDKDHGYYIEIHSGV